MFVDERLQPIPAWPSFLASKGSGMMPYLLWRESRPYFSVKKDWLIKLLDARLTGIALLVSTIALIIYALYSGNFYEFINQWQTSRFLYLMSLDFALLYLVFPTLLGDDMARRGWHDSRIFKGGGDRSPIGSFGVSIYPPSLTGNRVSSWMRSDEQENSVT